MDGSPEDEVTRPPEERDLIALARELNRLGVRYVVIGGLAINRLGYVRATDDIDLLIARDHANQQRVKQALEILPDKAVRDLGEDDLAQWLVVRVNDEITVDLMTEACGVSFDEASRGIETVDIDGVAIPFASAALRGCQDPSRSERDLSASGLDSGTRDESSAKRCSSMRSCRRRKSRVI